MLSGSAFGRRRVEPERTQPEHDFVAGPVDRDRERRGIGGERGGGKQNGGKQHAILLKWFTTGCDERQEASAGWVKRESSIPPPNTATGRSALYFGRGD